MQATSCPRIREAEQPNCESFKLLPCLWDKVQQNCPQEETHELKKIIGDSLVEESCDLYTEASTLLDIYQQMSVESDNELTLHSNQLVDPPEVRERAIREIVFLVDNLRLKSAKTGSRLQSPILEKNKAVIDYAAARTHECKLRPCSGHSRGSCSSTPLSDESQASSATEIAPDPEQVTVLAIDASLDQIREALALECTDRKTYITRLQAHIDGVMDHGSSRVPSLKELRQTTSQLEGELLSKTSSSSTKPHPPFHPAPQQRHSLRRASMPLHNKQPQLKLTENCKHRRTPLLLDKH